MKDPDGDVRVHILNIDVANSVTARVWLRRHHRSRRLRAARPDRQRQAPQNARIRSAGQQHIVRHLRLLSQWLRHRTPIRLSQRCGRQRLDDGQCEDRYGPFGASEQSDPGRLHYGQASDYQIHIRWSELAVQADTAQWRAARRGCWRRALCRGLVCVRTCVRLTTLLTASLSPPQEIRAQVCDDVLRVP